MEGLMEMILEVSRFYAGYKIPIIHDFSFSVGAGELVGILGRNGSGKSTLLRGLTGNLRHIQGQVHVQGINCLSMSARQRARRIALLPQYTPVFPGLRVSEVLEMGRYSWDSPLHPSTTQNQKLIQRAAEIFGITALLETDCAQLSQGQRQLVHLARIAVQNAPVLLLDEPNSALDFQNTHQFFRILTTLLSENSKCAVVVLHDPTLALRWCQRLLLLDSGRLIEELHPTVSSASEIQSGLSHLYPGIQVKTDKESGTFFCTID
jgi:ABC-type cobalamin/Fe3+-siderophores transport system ATPase subunit